MGERKTKQIGLYVLFAVIILFLLSRLTGTYLFGNNWSFTQWQFIPSWHVIVWLAAFVVMVAVLFFQQLLQTVISNKWTAVTAGTILIILFYLFRFDSFVFGDGNLRVNQIAIVDKVFIRWFEYGATGVVFLLSKLLMALNFLFDEPTPYRLKLAAGANAWLVFSFLCTIASLIASMKIAAELTGDALKRMALFLTLFFGPHTLLYFGYTGVEPVVITFTIWFAYLILKLDKNPKTIYLLFVWITQLVGLLVHISLIYLLPATVFVTVAFLVSGNNRYRVAAGATGIAWVLLIAVLYYAADRDFVLSQYIMFLSGKNPNADYGLFSPRHLGDFLQGLWLVFPQLIFLIYVAVSRKNRIVSLTAHAAMVMALSGMTVFFVLDPLNGIIADLPRFTAYLTPLSVLLALRLKDHQIFEEFRPLVTAVLVSVCVMFPLSYVTAHTSIENADPYIDAYFEKHETFYLTGSIAMRDAYFYKKNVDRANAWEWSMPVNSQDFLNFRGCIDLADAGRDAEALGVTYRIIVQHPYWVAPRELAISSQLKVGRPNLAKPQIDTCLILEPYRSKHHLSLYRYHRVVGNLSAAFSTLNRAHDLFGDDPDILTDLMVMYHDTRDYARSDSLADQIISADSTIPFPYAIKGHIAEVRGQNQQAIRLYEKFVSLAPDDPDMPNIRKRLNELVLIQQQP